MAKIAAGILGATGTVGQKFIRILQDHPWFEITALAASDRSVGRTYAEAVAWKQPDAIPASVAGMVIQPCRADLDCRLVFSGLGSDVAGDVEKEFAEAGCWVFSNASNHRMEEDVPLLIAELNADHLAMVEGQRRRRGWPGAIVTNPNCSTIVLALALGPLHAAFGVKAVSVVTLQAVSGAGYPGLPSLDILGNVVPFIRGEEEKIEEETLKILGLLDGDTVREADFPISAQATRVPVQDGHLACVSVALRDQPDRSGILECWESFRGRPQQLELPTAPRHPLVVASGEDRPQPRLDVEKFRGMSILIGRLRPCPLHDFRFVALGHNTLRGAAGASVLNAELALKEGFLE